MPVKTINLWTEADRRQAMADALMDQAIGGPPAIDTRGWNESRVTPTYGIGHGLIDIGQKLAAAWGARRQQRAADRERIEQENRDRVRFGLPPLPMETPGPSRKAKALAARLRGEELELERDPEGDELMARLDRAQSRLDSFVGPPEPEQRTPQMPTLGLPPELAFEMYRNDPQGYMRAAAQAAQQQKQPDYGFTEVGSTLLRTDPRTGTATPVFEGQPRGGDTPANIQEFEYYNALPSDEAREEYLRVKRGEQGPSSTLEKRLFETNDAAFKARANVQRYNQIADDMLQAMPAAGVRASWTEMYKRATGQEDAVSLLRKDWNNLRVSAAVQNLPPGVASDKDIELVMSAFLPEFANPEAVASFMRGLSKLEGLKADYHEFESDFLSQNGTVVGLGRAWRDFAAQQYGTSGPAPQPTGGQPSAPGLDMSKLSDEELRRLAGGG